MQAIFTLSQFSAKLTPKQNTYLSKKIAKKTDNTFLCLESFVEAAKNLESSTFKHLNHKSLKEKHFLNVSYVSSDSFDENKREGAYKNTEKVPTVLINKNRQFLFSNSFYQKLFHGLRHGNQFVFDIQVRNFKTDRSIKAELNRNPSVLSRIKNNLGVSNEIEGKPVPEAAGSTERLKQMLSHDDPTITDLEKQRIKIAFAEGYVAGNHPNAGKTSRASRYFKVVQQVLTVVIFLAIVVSLMASANGSVFR